MGRGEPSCQRKATGANLGALGASTQRAGRAPGAAAAAARLHQLVQGRDEVLCRLLARDAPVKCNRRPPPPQPPRRRRRRRRTMSFAQQCTGGISAAPRSLTDHLKASWVEIATADAQAEAESRENLYETYCHHFKGGRDASGSSKHLWERMRIDKTHLRAERNAWQKAAESSAAKEPWAVKDSLEKRDRRFASLEEGSAIRNIPCTCNADKCSYVQFHTSLQ